jgi:hypothetical protein
MGMPTATVQPSTNQSNGKGQSGNAPRQFQEPDGMENIQTLPAIYEPSASMMSPAVMPRTQSQQPMGKGGRNITMPSQGGQPRMGQPNAYSNTIQPWDNASIQPQARSGKGKGY